MGKKLFSSNQWLVKWKNIFISLVWPVVAIANKFLQSISNSHPTTNSKLLLNFPHSKAEKNSSKKINFHKTLLRLYIKKTFVNFDGREAKNGLKLPSKNKRMKKVLIFMKNLIKILITLILLSFLPFPNHLFLFSVAKCPNTKFR